MNTILVVDDESKIREVIKEYGKVNGYNVLEAQDSDSAIEIVKKEKINCIILDIMLPNIDGFTACQMIKKFVILQSLCYPQELVKKINY